jgi:hypothetical protein
LCFVFWISVASSGQGFVSYYSHEKSLQLWELQRNTGLRFGALRRIVQFSVDQAVDFDRDRIGRSW